MFQGLGDRLAKIFDKLSRRGILTEQVVDETMREIKIALLEADVALPVVKSFIADVRAQAVGETVIKSVSPSQMVVKIVHDALVRLLGEPCPLAFKTKGQTVVMMVGLQGSGKTTSSGKLALRLQKEGKKVLLTSLDTYRPAAQEQLAEVAAANGLSALPIVAGESPLQITQRALKEGQFGLYDVVILDTAGRLHIDEKMMQEIVAIRDVAQPDETLLVVDAMMGQDAVQVATAFHGQLGITGIVLTRVDGDARGGAALSLRSLTGVPIQFLGVGEKATALEVFDAKRVADRILGMGDVVGLVETALEQVNQEEAIKTAERMMDGQFDLNDMLSQMQQINRLGDIKGIMKMIPGMRQFQAQIDKADISNQQIRRQEAIILSMTPYERRYPQVIKAARKQRIAGGAGVSVNDVNRLLKQYEQMAQVMKKFKKMGPLGMMSLVKKMGVLTDGNNPLMKRGGFPPFN